MADIDPSKIDHIGIYPTIGIARVGNSEVKEEGDGWYVGPEVPGRFDIPPGGFKDTNFGVKRQAARFRVYAFAADGTVLCEANRANGFDLDWKFQIANKKPSWYTFMGKEQPGAFLPGNTTLRNPNVQPHANPEDRTDLIINSGIQGISGPNSRSVTLQGHIKTDKGQADVYLGEAHTDSEGHLVVLAGRGLSRSIAKEDEPYPLILTDFDSPDWVDDTSDGWVDAKVDYKGKSWTAPTRARVIGTTPKFVNGIYAPTTLYDVMENIYEEPKRKQAGYKVAEPGWNSDIWPLLQRPVGLSWVNGQANGGHGPNGPGHFLDANWQKALTARTPEGDDTRKNVLGRMRLPETPDKRYDSARSGQGFTYFMPWLSGDNGRTTAGDISTFTAVTELQYDRLKAWSEGNFKDDEPLPEPPVSIEKVALQEQPHALTKASLEATIGSPLYPGIEMSWNAELPETYDPKRPFTIENKVKEGDLTKYLSLPWQSDFYMCRNYWWPSARPDAIVPEKSFDEIVKSVKPKDLPKELTTRVPWERGIHQNYTDTYGDQPLFANTDMAQRWHELGFVVRQQIDAPEPIYVERQRNLATSNSKTKNWKLAVGHANDEKSSPHHGIGISLPAPDTKDEPITSIKSLQDHLRIAMGVELSTIPIYLAAMYSVKPPAQYRNDPRYYDPIIGAIRGIVAEEMLHLTLAGNVLRSVGGKFKVYDPDYIPQYPMDMPGRIPRLELKLTGLTKDQLYVFTQIELPEKPDAAPEPDKYHTLGQFYKAIQRGLVYLNDKSEQLFHPDTKPFQYGPGVGYQPHIHDAGGSVLVTDLKSAEGAIKVIVEQGEGEVKDPEHDDPSGAEKDHYEIFTELLKGVETGTTKFDLYPMIEDASAKNYLTKYKNKQLYQVSLAFNAAYCYLLQTIDKLWELHKDDERRSLVNANLYGIMIGVLKPLAQFFTLQPVGKEGKVGAPTFQYYPFSPNGPSALKQLQNEFQTAVDSYVKITHADSDETPDQVVVHNYGEQLELLLPIQNAVKSLLDIETFEKIDTKLVKNVTPGVHSRGAKGWN